MAAAVAWLDTWCGASVVLAISIAWSGVVGVVGVVAYAVLRAQRRRIPTGSEGLVGEVGTAETDLTPNGKVFVHGELWSAIANEVISKGQAIQVARVEGMVLRVTRATD